jgi:hypothetical protein
LAHIDVDIEGFGVLHRTTDNVRLRQFGLLLLPEVTGGATLVPWHRVMQIFGSVEAIDELEGGESD